MPRAVFDYTDGAAEQEVSIVRARELFRRTQLLPSVLRDVSQLDTSITLFGDRLAQPFVLAPTGFSRMMHHEGERAVARAAQRRGVAYSLSTMGTCSIEDVSATAPNLTRWFQLYPCRDRGMNERLLRRAREAGYSALLLTVDVPVGGSRLRDTRNGFAFPPRLGAATYLDGIRHPAWTVNLLTTPPLAFASLGGSTAELGRHMQRLFDPTMTERDLEWIRAAWDGPIIIKGIQSLDDARRVTAAGADGIVLSNHGGRQLDRAPTPLRLLTEVVDAVGDRTVVGIDSGILTGGDIAACLALGARFTMVGRAYLYGLMAGGEAGVDRAVEILANELRRTMQLLGVRAVAELRREHVRLPAHD